MSKKRNGDTLNGCWQRLDSRVKKPEDPRKFSARTVTKKIPDLFVSPSLDLRLQIVYKRRARNEEVPRICSGEVWFVKHGMSNALFVTCIAVQFQKSFFESRMQVAVFLHGFQCVAELCLLI